MRDAVNGRRGNAGQRGKDQRWYMEQYKSDECLCGRPKARRYAFCFRCYASLPRDMQRALWRRFGQGYEEAYDAAAVYLGSL